MHLHPKRLPRRVLASLAMLLAFWAPSLLAQGTTTGSLSGVVTDEAGETALPGAVITAVHTPTGTTYSVTSGGDGRFTIQNVRVGGPYTVTVAMESFKTSEQTDVFVGLGETKDLRFGLPLALEETVTVVAESNRIINPSRTGAASNVSVEAITSLPTVSRGIEDFARTNPFFSTNSDNDGAAALTVAGRNNRYNNIQIDGAVNNDLFGLAAQGVPGGQAEAQPISLDAIQELQLLVAPYDVRQGGFSGGGVNAVTKSGTNSLSGGVYYYTRDQDLVGDGAQDRPLGTFSEDQYGISLGGPILRNKAFFFVNGEISRLDRPSGFSIGGGSGQDFGSRTEAERFRSILTGRYGYDPGGFEEVTRTTDSDKAFLRLDLNLGDSNQLTARHNYIDANNDILFQGNVTYRFPENVYHFLDETNSSVLQLNSVISGSLFNEARLTYQTIRDQRAGDVAFPFVQVRGISPGNRTFEAGTERFSTANALDQDILEITDDLTWITGNHTVTIGTHNEFFSFENLFIRDNYGAYVFNNLDDFERGWASQFDYSFSNTSNPDQAAKFDVQQFGLYVGDRWTVRPNLTLTFGIRADVPFFPDEPSYNATIDQVFGFRTDELPDGNILLSPRIGFNWDISGSGKQQLRGGIGIFAGRTPYVWLSNQYGNTGIEFTRLSARVVATPERPISETNSIPFNSDPFNQPRSVGGAVTNEVDVTDPDFEFPQVLRTNLGFDQDLGIWGLIASAELIYSQNEQEIAYQNLNFVPTGSTLAFDGRPTFRRRDSRFSDVILLTNTDKGDQFTAAFKLERPFRDGLAASVSYAYGEAESVNDGNSSQAVSNWRFVYHPGDPNNPALATSDYSIEHRFNASLSWEARFWERAPTTFGVFYNAQSGRPYSTTFANDVNGDTNDNDLLYVPASASEVLFCTSTVAATCAMQTRDSGIQAQQWALFNAYVESDEGLRGARGSIIERNASRAPWFHQLDFHAEQSIPVSIARVSLILDVLNFANLFDSDTGQVRYVQFDESSPVFLAGIDAATGKPIYRLTLPAQRFSTDDLRSRWQAKLGLRVSF
ncbi:MAG TPA: carboxypeptidase regulatory-like domain-containing protein [Thermoanaerobaculia bacterium]|nr:carboxypeptidase regulatory-like domain-containing protein [Thermoanaerobaculia bacterium]